MTTATDASMFELIAGCEQLAQEYARALRAVQQLASAGLQCAAVSPLWRYKATTRHKTPRATSNDLAFMRQLKSMLTVHEVLPVMRAAAKTVGMAEDAKPRWLVRGWPPPIGWRTTLATAGATPGCENALASVWDG